MAHNYYQPQQPPQQPPYPQYYKPQNIYQQLGQPEPLPRQQPYPQPGLYQPQQPQQQPQQPQQPPQQYYPYPQHRSQPSPLYSQWANPQVQAVPYPPPSVHAPAQPQRRPLPLPVKRSDSTGPGPSSIPRTVPLQGALSSINTKSPFPTPSSSSSNSSPTRSQPQPSSQPPSQSSSPTRSRPLPTPAPGPPKPRPASSFIPQQQITPPTLRRTPSPVKSTNPLTNSVHTNPDSPIKRGRASPPRFSIPSSAPSTSNSPFPLPSQRSTDSSLTPGSVSAHSSTQPPDTNLTRKSGASKPIVKAPAENVRNNTNTAPSAPPSASASAGSSTSDQPKKFVPIWKRTIPDVLPPLYPPHILLAQRGPPVPQPQTQTRPAPAPARAVPATQPQSQFSRPANANTTAPNVNGYNYNPNGYNATSYAPQRNGPAQPGVIAYARRQDESSSEEEGDEEEDESEEEENAAGQHHHDRRYGHQPHVHPDDDGELSDSSTESDLSDEDPQMPADMQDPRGRGGRPVEPERSPQYGIRDLPKRMDVGPLPQPPVMVRNGQGQSAPAPSRPQSSWDGSGDVRRGSEFGRNDRSSSRTMRLAAGSSGADAGGGGAGAWPQGLPRLPRTPGNNSSAGRQIDLNLDDTPPPASPSFAMRRTPSPSPVLEHEVKKRRELPQPQPFAQMRMLGRESRERPQSQIYGASTSSSQGQGQVDRPRPQSQIYTHGPAPGPVKQQHGGPRAPSQMQHHHQRQMQHQRREFEGGNNEEDYQVPVISGSGSGSQDEQTRRQTLPQRQPVPQYQPQSGDRSQSPYQPQHQPQHQHRHQHQHQPHQPQPHYQPPHHQPQRQQPPQPHYQHEGPQMQPQIKIESPAPVGGRDRLADIPRIELEGAAAGLPSISVMNDSDYDRVPAITIQGDDDNDVPRGRGDATSRGGGGRGGGEANGPQINVFEVPGISIAGPEESDVPAISVPGDEGRRQSKKARAQIDPQHRRGGLICGGCDGPIVGRIVNAMGARWHSDCFRCTVCDALLEHVSSYEHEGRAYCHLDYHENFAPRCYSCKTAIIEERFISLDDPALGKRTYHEQHFFCAECGDPFLSPSSSSNLSSRTGELNLSGDGDFEADDVGFTVYRGHPYCEACHVRLRLPKCKRCKRSIRDGDKAVEALGGKWCWGCFVCASCQKPFENPSFFQRGDQPYCEPCFSIILRNEV